MKIETSLLTNYANRNQEKDLIIKQWPHYTPSINEGRVTYNRADEPILVWLYITFYIPDGEKIPDNLPGVRRVKDD